MKQVGILGVALGGATTTAEAVPTDRVYRAGAARFSINPTQSHLDDGLFMGGFGGFKDRGPATGVHDDISARALAVSSKDELVAFVMIDTVGLGNEVIQRIRSNARERLGSAADDVDRHSILVGSTHSHSGPDFQGLWGGVPGDYLDYVIDQAGKAVAAAVNSRVRARLRVGEVKMADYLVSNRRGWGFVDDTLTTVQFTAASNRRGQNASTGETIGTLLNFAAHPVIIGSQNNQLATDFVGSLERTVEDRFGGTAIYFNGAQGDASPARPDAPNDKESAETYGRLVADEATAALESSKPVPHALSVESTTVTFPQDNTSFDYAYVFGYYDDYYEYRNLTTIELPPFGEVTVPESITTPVTRVSFGRSDASLQAVTIPGEAVTRLGLDIREQIGGRHQALLGLTQNALGYIIPTDEWQDTPEGDYYEETVSLGRETAPLYREAVDRLF